MVTYKRYDMTTYQNFLKTPIGQTFGFSREQTKAIFEANSVAENVFYRAYPDLRNNFNEFCQIIEEKGMSPILFIQIMIAEGGGAANFINHWSLPDSSPDWRICLRDDLAYIFGGVATRTPNSGFGSTSYPSMMTSRPYTPSVSAPECGNWVSEDNAGSLQGFFNSLPDNTIGRYYMPATLAGNAWVWCTNSCTNNYVTYAQSLSQPYGTKGCYFGNPYDDIISFLANNGIDVNNQTSGNQVPGKSPGSNVSPDSKQNNVSGVQKTIDEMLASPLTMSQIDNKLLLSDSIMITRTFGNTYQINKLNPVAEPPTPTPTPTPDPSPKPINPNNPNSGNNSNADLLSKIYNWSQNNLGKMYTPIFGGSPGAGQCYEYFMTVVSNVIGGNASVFIGTGQNAIDLRPPENGGTMTGVQIEQMGSLKWHDVNSVAEYNQIPNGAIVVLSNPTYDLGYGHVATKSGDWIVLTSQNQTPGQWGAPITNTNLGAVSGYTVYGAWY